MEELREKFFDKVKELKELHDFGLDGETKIVDFGYKKKTKDNEIYSIVDWGNVFNWITENFVPVEAIVLPKIADFEEMQKLLGIQKTEIEKLKSLLRETYQFLSDAPELNMSNYDTDQVSELNNKMIDAYCNLNYNQSNFSA